MFNLGLGEVSIVIVIAALAFGVDEFKHVYQWLRAAQRKMFEFKSHIYNELDEAEALAKEKIVDLEGNLQKTYSLDAVAALLDENKKEQSDE